MTMRLSVVLSTHASQFAAATFKGDLDTSLGQIETLGYEGVELAIRDPALVDVQALERLLAAHRLSVPAIGTGQAWGEEGLSFTDPDAAIRREAIERVKSHIPVAERLGAVIIIGLVRGVVKPGVAPGQAMGWLVSAARECAAAAAAPRVRLALEPINRYETSLINNAREGLELIKQVDQENFGLLLDTFHMNIEEVDIEASIAACGSHIFHFHVADSNRWHPGAGHLNFSSILEALRCAGYAGWISGEFLPQPDAFTAARKSIELLREM